MVPSLVKLSNFQHLGFTFSYGLLEIQNEIPTEMAWWPQSHSAQVDGFYILFIVCLLVCLFVFVDLFGFCFVLFLFLFSFCESLQFLTHQHPWWLFSLFQSFPLLSCIEVNDNHEFFAKCKENLPLGPDYKVDMNLNQPDIYQSYFKGL